MNIDAALSECKPWQRVTNGIEFAYPDGWEMPEDAGGDWEVDEEYCNEEVLDKWHRQCREDWYS